MFAVSFLTMTKCEDVKLSHGKNLETSVSTLCCRQRLVPGPIPGSLLVFADTHWTDQLSLHHSALLTATMVTVFALKCKNLALTCKNTHT